MRDPFAQSLIALAETRPDIFVLDGDCSHSTRSYRFGERYPHAFLNVGIAEQNMISMAAGLAHAGFRPIACGFAAIVAARAAEQIIQSIAYPSLNVKIAGHYAGMSASREGAPHHAITDIAFLRAVPNMAIWSPADDGDVGPVLETVLDTAGPAYLRLSRNPVPALEGGPYDAAGGYRFWDGGGDVLLVATGSTVREARAATAILERRSPIRASVLGLVRIKPLAGRELSRLLGRFRTVVTIEEHNVIGGIGSAIAEILSGSAGRLIRLGIADCFTETGSHDELLDAYGISAEAIARRVIDAHAPALPA